MVLRETGAKLLIIILNAHADESWPASCKRDAITDQLFRLPSYADKYLAGQVLERPRVNAALESLYQTNVLIDQHFSFDYRPKTLNSKADQTL